MLEWVLCEIKDFCFVHKFSSFKLLSQALSHLITTANIIGQFCG